MENRYTRNRSRAFWLAAGMLLLAALACGPRPRSLPAPTASPAAPTSTTASPEALTATLNPLAEDQLGFSGAASSTAAPPANPGPTPTEISLTPLLAAQLDFASLGGVTGTLSGACAAAEGSGTGTLPAIYGGNRVPLSNYVALCLDGFLTEPGLPYALALYAPDGNVYTTGFSLVDFNLLDGVAGEYFEGGTIAVGLWMPPGVPTGEWGIQVEAPEQVVEGQIAVPGFGLPWVGIVPEGPFDPLVSGEGGLEYPEGTPLKAVITGYQPGQALGLGVYALPPEGRQGELVGSADMVIGEDGSATASLVEPLAPTGSGRYCLGIYDPTTAKIKEWYSFGGCYILY